MAQTGRSRKTI